MRRGWGPALALAGGLALPATAAAQNPPAPPPRPAVRADSARGRAGGDSLRAPPRPAAGPDSIPPPDSLSPDSFSAVLPPLGPPAGPLPSAGRVVFDRDALVFSGALTLGELLQAVPGAFLARAGWYGLPEVVHYAGQGASSVEVYWDGYALDPMGEDSAGFDVGRIPLGLLRRVEVEVLPTVLRVHLVSDTQPVRRPRTETSFATGDGQTNSYRIRYLNRWAGGAGLGLGVNWFGTNGARSTPARSSDLTLWAKASWAATTRFGVEAQLMRYSLDRASLQDVLPGRRVYRSDMILRAFSSSREDGLGLRFDALLGASSYGDSAGAEAARIAQGAVFAAYRAERWSAEAVGRVRDARMPLEVELRGSVAALRRLTAHGYAIRRTLLGGRGSSEAGGSVSWMPLGPFRLEGAFRARDAVAVPALAWDTSQSVKDWSVGVGVASRRADLDVSLERHGWYVAPAYGTFGGLVPLATAIDVRTVTVRFALRPKAYFTLAGWYRHPIDALTAAYEPPHHARTSATFRSRFLPRYRRGALDVLVQAALESWSDGVMGADSAGTAIGLDGHGSLDWLVEVRLLGAVIYWTLRNSQLERYEVVPGAELARSLQRYGVRWEFTN